MRPELLPFCGRDAARPFCSTQLAAPPLIFVPVDLAFGVALIENLPSSRCGIQQSRRVVPTGAPRLVSVFVSAPTSGDQHDIDYARVVVTPKADAPVAYSQPPLTRKTVERPHVACR